MANPAAQAPVPHSARCRRRGTVLVAILIALVVLQLAVVGVVISGTREHDLSADRIEGARAFYAAEAGANMAMREWMRQADDDGDGGIGTISNDNNEDTDPAIGSARFHVLLRTVGPDTVLVVRSRCGSAARQLELTVDQ